jgi:hypothetical protein
MKKEAIGSFETLVHMYQTTHRHIPDDRNFQSLPSELQMSHYEFPHETSSEPNVVWSSFETFRAASSSERTPNL